MESKVKQNIISLLRNNSQGLTIAGLAERLQFSRHTVTVGLAELKGERAITIRKVGMAKLIYLKDIERRVV
tara:strand:- start:5252 stop:5464 length:213 start_codon:yes stop_codon:yes gene_type:complete